MDSRAQDPISENLSSIDRKLDGLQDCRLKIDHIEEVLLRLQASISSQTTLLHEVQKQVGLRGTTQEVQKVIRGSNSLTKGAFEFESTVATPPASQPVSILKKPKVQTEDDLDLVPLPEDHPQAFPVVPSQVNQREGRLSCVSRTSVGSQGAAVRSPPQQESHGKRLSVFSQMSSSRFQKRGTNSVSSAEAASVDELSLKTTRKLLRGFSALSVTGPPDEQGCNETNSRFPAQPSKQSSRVAVLENLEKTNNISLDQLRTSHNALVTAMSMRSVSTLGTGSGMSGMLFPAELLLVLAGVMEMWSPWLGLLWVCFLFVLFLGGTVVLAWWSGAGVLEVDSALASFCYMAGIAASIWRLRRREIQELLKDDESSLDMYARQAGFVTVWRWKSKKQFIQAIGCLILLCVSRCLAYTQAPVSSHELIQTSTFCFASIGFVAVTYLQLHISQGLELAIDSFAVNFFKDMDFEKALAECNVLQAMLRHVSTKLSGSLLMLGVSSGSSILFLIELSFVRTDVGGGFGFIVQNLWSLPPIILFFYTMMRAAAVTEKANRVSPLVNSWTFEEKDEPGEYRNEQEWMDLERQYLVQYINQSEAGFYVQGVKIRTFQVTKLCYYLGAVLFAIVSQSAM